MKTITKRLWYRHILSGSISELMDTSSSTRTCASVAQLLISLHHSPSSSSSTLQNQKRPPKCKKEQEPKWETELKLGTQTDREWTKLREEWDSGQTFNCNCNCRRSSQPGKSRVCKCQRPRTSSLLNAGSDDDDDNYKEEEEEEEKMKKKPQSHMRWKRGMAALWETQGGNFQLRQIQGYKLKWAA